MVKSVEEAGSTRFVVGGGGSVIGVPNVDSVVTIKLAGGSFLESEGIDGSWKEKSKSPSK